MCLVDLIVVWNQAVGSDSAIPEEGEECQGSSSISNVYSLFPNGIQNFPLVSMEKHYAFRIAPHPPLATTRADILLKLTSNSNDQNP